MEPTSTVWLAAISVGWLGLQKSSLQITKTRSGGVTRAHILGKFVVRRVVLWKGCQIWLSVCPPGVLPPQDTPFLALALDSDSDSDDDDDDDEDDDGDDKED